MFIHHGVFCVYTFRKNKFFINNLFIFSKNLNKECNKNNFNCWKKNTFNNTVWWLDCEETEEKEAISPFALPYHKGFQFYRWFLKYPAYYFFKRFCSFYIEFLKWQIFRLNIVKILYLLKLDREVFIQLTHSICHQMILHFIR